jgi:tetratricopeptide (TPR) repeat protein
MGDDPSLRTSERVFEGVDMRKLSMLLMLMIATTVLRAQEPKFVLPLPGDSEFIKQSFSYSQARDGKALKIDVYRPKGTARVPVAVMLNGVGMDMRTHPQYTGWGAAVTTVGLAGVVMDSESGAIEKNFDDVMGYLRKHAAELNMDAERVVLYSCSANVTSGLPIAMSGSRTYIKSAVVYYGNARVNSFRRDVPVMLVRAGLDSTQLNKGLDAMFTSAVQENAPWSMVNIAGGQHGFDVFDDNDESRAVVRATLAFMRDSLQTGMQQAIAKGQAKAEAAGYLSAEKWPEAAEAYERVTKAEPTDSAAHWRLAQALEHMGQDKRAIDEYERALDLGNFNRGLISYSAAKLSLKTGDKERALAFVERMKGIRPMVERLRTEKDFDVIRADAKFQAVLQSVPAQP